jgi:hypothetical protein
MSKCPNKSSGEYKKLFKYYQNEDAVYSMYLANKDDIPMFPNITEIKKGMGFVTAYYTDRKTANLINRLAKYNEEHNTRHNIKLVVSNDDVITHKLHLNFTPKYARLDGVERIIEDNEVDGVVYEHSEVDKNVEDLGDGTYNVDGEIVPSTDYNARYAFQVSNKAKQTSTNALDYFLVDYLSKFGITVEQITDFKERFGVDGIAVSDLINKIISVSDGKSDITTLPEEASHFIIEMLGENHPLYQSMAKNIKESKEYEDVVKEYGELYDMDEKRLVKEAMGKVLAKHIMNKYEGKNASVLDRIITWFKNIFKKFSKTNLQSGIDDIYTKVAEGVLNNTLELSADNIKDKNYYFELRDSSSKLLDTLKKNIERLNNRAAEIARKTASNESNAASNELKQAASILKAKIDNNQVKSAVITFLDFIKSNELKSMIEEMNRNKEGDGDTLSSRNIKEIYDITTLYSTILDDIMQLDLPSEFNDMKDAIVDDTKDISYQLKVLNTYAKNQHEDRIRKILDEISITYIGQDGKPMQFDPEELLNSKVGNIGWVGANVMPMHSVNDEVLKMVWKIVSDIHNESYRKAYDNGKDLLALQENMAKAGFKDMSIFHERDENGKQTGYLISDKNWGIYNRELQLVKDRLTKMLGYDNYHDIVYDQLSKDDKNKYKNEWKKFATQYKQWDGTQYIPNPPVNKEFGKLLKSDKSIVAYYERLKQIHISSKENLPAIYNSFEKFWLMPQIRKDDMQIMASENDSLSVKMKNLAQRTKDKWQIKSDDIGFGDQSGVIIKGVTGKKERLLPIYFTRPLDDMSQLSNNITGMYAHFSEMAYNFNGLAKRLDDLHLIQISLANRKVFKNNIAVKRNDPTHGIESNEYKAMDNFLKINVFGEHMDELIVNVGDKEYKPTKAINKVISYIRAKNLFMNVFTMLSGTIKGNIDSLVDSAAGIYTTKESHLWAAGEFAKAVPHFAISMMSKNKHNKVEIILERSGAIKNMHSIFDRLDLNNPLERVTMEDVIYGMYEPTSTQIKGIYALSIYDNNRLYNGKFVTRNMFDEINKGKSKSDLNKEWSELREKSLYNAYEAVNGKLVVRKEFEKFVTPEVENRVEGLIKTRTPMIEGTLGAMDRGAAHTSVVGSLILMHRGWIIQGAIERLKKGGINYNTQQFEEGFYRTAASYIIDFAKHQFNKETFGKPFKKDLQPYEIRNLKKGAVDLAMTLGLMSLYVLVNSAEEDDKDDYWAQFIAYLSTRAFLEQAAFHNPTEIGQILNSPSAALSSTDQLKSLFMSPFKTEDIKYGVYEGKGHMEKALIQLSPFKNMYELQDPAAKNKYIRSQIIN